MPRRSYKKRKVARPVPFKGAFSLLLLFLLALFLLGFFGDRGFIRGYQLYQEVSEVRQGINRLKQENRRLGEMQKQLDANPRIIERRAREDLGLVRKNELVYLFVPAAENK